MVSGKPHCRPRATPGQASAGGDSQIFEPADTRSCSAGSRSALKSQRAYVTHVLECIGRIAADSAPGRDAVFGSHTLQDAIIRNLQVLCESVRRIDAAYKDSHVEIDWKAIAGMRNVLVHDYFDVDFEAVWDVITRDLPPFEFVMRSILARMDPEG